MGFRTSINNLIRGDKPESPTDTIFIFGSVVLILLLIVVTFQKSSIPHVSEIIGFLVLCKGVKVAGVWAKKGAPNVDTPAV